MERFRTFDFRKHMPSVTFTLLAVALMQMAPSFSLRGGTREILRGIIARGLGLR